MSGQHSAVQARGPRLAPHAGHRWRTALGHVLGLLLWIWIRTWRVKVLSCQPSGLQSREPIVLCFWHGMQMALLGWPRRRRTAVMVSWSTDGALQAGVLDTLGLLVVRGSSSRGASSGLRAIVRALRAGTDAAFAVDGPRGPLGVVQSGAAAAAELAGSELIPMAAVAWPALVLSRTWDNYRLVLPFARVCIAFGPPLDPRCAREDPSRVAFAIDEAGIRAQAALRNRRRV
ncbi:MAG: DUF374 domain-containing protein [Polyangiaceae bacterium]|nr:DUF374 domain-containing protein [Polyangiaceae bacterium]